MKYLIGVIIAAVVIVGGWYYYSSSQIASQQAPQADTYGTTATPSPAVPSDTSDTKVAPVPVSAPKTTGVAVAYTANGFSPKIVTIKKGEKVTFTDQTGKGIWIASNVHPTHSEYSGTARSAHCPDTSGTAFDQCGPGSAYTFTFQKTGTWGYHDHMSPGDMGTVVVQ